MLNSHRIVVVRLQFPPLACGRIRPRPGVGADRQGAGSKGVKDDRTTSRSIPLRSATPIGRPASRKSRNSVLPARRLQWSRRSTVTPTCRFCKELAKLSASRRAIPQGRNLMGSAGPDGPGTATQGPRFANRRSRTDLSFARGAIITLGALIVPAPPCGGPRRGIFCSGLDVHLSIHPARVSARKVTQAHVFQHRDP
jgi:hypothetical protein